MSDATSADYLEPYRDHVRRHGTGFESTLWASPRSQVKRFEVFAQMAFLTGKRLLDVGCSRGDFAAYLLDRDIRFKKYIGLDAVPELVEYARARNLARCEFVLGDCVREPSVMRRGDPQIICISGTLNTMDMATVFRVLEGAWEATSQTLLFNFLSDKAHRRAPPQDHFARRLDTVELLEWALEKTWHVQFRQDYFRLGHDATIAMRKASNGDSGSPVVD